MFSVFPSFSCEQTQYYEVLLLDYTKPYITEGIAADKYLSSVISVNASILTVL